MDFGIARSTGERGREESAASFPEAASGRRA